MSRARTFDEWYQEGRNNHWLGKPFCYVHDVPPLTDEEQAEIEKFEGEMDVICFSVARIGDTEDPEVEQP